jgi:hypothetical protein
LVFIGFLCPKQYHKIEKSNKINSQNKKRIIKNIFPFITGLFAEFGEDNFLKKKHGLGWKNNLHITYL